MAYRRRQGITRASTFSVSSDDYRHTSGDASASSLAAQAIRASYARRDSSFSAKYGESVIPKLNRQTSSPARQDNSSMHQYETIKCPNESKFGLWSVLARKAKEILEDDEAAKQFESSSGPTRPQMIKTSTDDQFEHSYQSRESNQKTVSPKVEKGLDAITSSLDNIAGTIANVLEEGLTDVNNKAANIVSETRKLQIRRREISMFDATQLNPAPSCSDQRQLRQTMMHADPETQLKASRDAAVAMTSNAKIPLRELKTVKADLASAKERCAQLEQENKILRETHEKGDPPEDDDMIRIQLETLLAEKAQLANENAIYARENRFLLEIVEYHHLTMQDIVDVDERHEETVVYPVSLQPLVVDDSPMIPTPPTGVEVPSLSSPSLAAAHPHPVLSTPSTPLVDDCLETLIAASSGFKQVKT